MNIKEMKKQIEETSKRLNMISVQGLGNMQVVLGTMNCLDYIYRELENSEKSVKEGIPMNAEQS